MRIIFLCALLLIASFAGAQIITGRIVNEAKEPVTAATISLLRAKDSLLLKSAIASKDGSFSVMKPDSIAALLYITATGYTGKYLPVNDPLMGELQLSKQAASLKEVVVAVKKPLIEVRPDKLVFNVEGSINASGSNGLELLQKSPGVIVDKDDNIILSGKNGVKIYIDGKPSPLAGSDLAAYLRGVNSNDIEAIEIITNPSARYDAEGNAGIINIRMKKNKNFGWNGNLTGGYGIGIYSKYNGGFSLNHRDKKLNFFSNVSGYDNLNENQLNLYRLQNDTFYNQRSTGINKSKGLNAKTGLDVFINAKSTLGVLFNAGLGETDANGNSKTPISAQGSPDINRVLTALGRSEYKRTNISSNINYKYADTSGHLLAIDLDHAYYSLRNSNTTPNYYTDGKTGQQLSVYTFGTHTPTTINLLSLKTDYEQNLGKAKLSVGFKTSRVKTSNQFSYYNYDNNNQPVFDNQRSNHFTYTEWINAVYAQYQRKLKKFDYQLGVRLEHTSSEGLLEALNANANQDVKRNYLDVFPSAGVNYQMNKLNSWGLTYSRRIDRPRYQDLNPFENKIDELSYQKGNPFLKPQYTDVVELRHIYKYSLTTTLSYSAVRDFFAQVTDTIEGKRTFIMQRNLATQKIISLGVSYPFSITKWWSVYANLNVYHTRYRATFEQGKTIKLDATVGSIYQQQTFQLGKKWTAELSGFFSSPSIWGGTYKTKSIWSLDAGLQKKFWKDNATIKASVTDIFMTMPLSGESNFGGLNIIASGRWESRQFKINFTYRFGNLKLKTTPRHQSGIEDLNQRVN